MFFWVFLRRQILVCRRFGTHCQVHLQRLDAEYEHFIFCIQPLKIDLTEGPETSANHNLTPRKYPKEHIQYSKHGESLKSRLRLVFKGLKTPCLMKSQNWNLLLLVSFEHWRQFPCIESLRESSCHGQATDNKHTFGTKIILKYRLRCEVPQIDVMGKEKSEPSRRIAHRK
jgi:hypothetical protein